MNVKLNPDATKKFDIDEIFLGKMGKRFASLEKSKVKTLVHYTSSSAFFNIVKNKSVWMRNARCMNDFLEIQYALEAIYIYFSDSGRRDRFRRACESCHEGVFDELDKLITGHQSSLIEHAYITCLSEHHRIREPKGRLSMWRAYDGKEVPIAVYLRKKVLIGDGPYGLQGYPVSYLTYEEIYAEINERVAYIEKWQDWIASKIQKDQFLNTLFSMFQILSVTVKHPGFVEEKEWRLVYLPKIYPSKVMDENARAECLSGIPQKIHVIPIDGRKIENTNAVRIDKLLEKIVVGPSFEHKVTIEGVVQALKDSGITNPQRKVIFCGIPYRARI